MQNIKVKCSKFLIVSEMIFSLGKKLGVVSYVESPWGFTFMAFSSFPLLHLQAFINRKRFPGRLLNP